GVRDLELNELTGGVSVIIGPNGSGKTTTCRAIRGLIWPKLLNADYPELSADWDIDGGKRLTTVRKGEEKRYFLDSQPADAPAAPAEHFAPCYTITIDDLFDGTSAELAAEVDKDMAGGFDLRAVRQAESLSFQRG